MSNGILLSSTGVLQYISCEVDETGRCTYCVALALLLVEQLRGLRHGQTDELVLTTRRLLVAAAVEHLQCLHSSSGADVVRGCLLAASLLVAIELLVLLNSIVFIDVLVLELLLVTSELAKNGAEQVGVS